MFASILLCVAGMHTYYDCLALIVIGEKIPLLCTFILI